MDTHDYTEVLYLLFHKFKISAVWSSSPPSISSLLCLVGYLSWLAILPPAQERYAAQPKLTTSTKLSMMLNWYHLVKLIVCLSVMDDVIMLLLIELDHIHIVLSDYVNAIDEILECSSSTYMNTQACRCFSSQMRALAEQSCCFNK